MDLCSGSKDLTVPSLMFMRLLHGTFLSSGKPPGRPPDLDILGKTSQCAAPNSDPRGIGARKETSTTLGGLGKLKEEGNLLPLSL